MNALQRRQVTLQTLAAVETVLQGLQQRCQLFCRYRRRWLQRTAGACQVQPAQPGRQAAGKDAVLEASLQVQGGGQCSGRIQTVLHVAPPG
ncbi:hypothetical protein PPS11_40228 [Pseudomonas putida S11]|nr:hypothetical protein PPS11_40228 [Pseudomonas putida S11]